MHKLEGFLKAHSDEWYKSINAQMSQYRAITVEFWIEAPPRSTEVMETIQQHPTYRKERKLYVDYHIVSFKLNTAQFYEAVIFINPLAKRTTLKSNGFESNLSPFYKAIFQTNVHFENVKDPDIRNCVEFLQSYFI